MKIIKTYDWIRRDFRFDAACEFCQAVETKCSGYDDGNYYDNVIPDKKCKSCNKSTKSEGGKVEAIHPRHNPYATI